MLTSQGLIGTPFLMMYVGCYYGPIVNKARPCCALKIQLLAIKSRIALVTLFSGALWLSVIINPLRWILSSYNASVSNLRKQSETRGKGSGSVVNLFMWESRHGRLSELLRVTSRV